MRDRVHPGRPIQTVLQSLSEVQHGFYGQSSRQTLSGTSSGTVGCGGHRGSVGSSRQWRPSGLFYTYGIIGYFVRDCPQLGWFNHQLSQFRVLLGQYRHRSEVVPRVVWVLRVVLSVVGQTIRVSVSQVVIMVGFTLFRLE